MIFGLSPLGVYVENLSEYSVKSPEEIVRLLKSGKRRLVVAETKMNRQSSRLVRKIKKKRCLSNWMITLDH